MSKSDGKIKAIFQKIDKDLINKMIIWRLVLAKMGTYTEIETQWTFSIIMEANEVLDIKEDMTQVSMPKTNKE